MRHYKTILSSVAFIALLSGCGDANNQSQTPSTSKVEITKASIDKNDAVYASEDSLVNSMGKRAVEVSEGQFIEESIDELVPKLVDSYVPDSYVEEVLAIDELQSESLMANRKFIEELQLFYASAHTDDKRASNVSTLYDIVASISGQIYDIIYNYLFGDTASIGDVYDDLNNALFGDDSNTTSSVAVSSLSSSNNSSEEVVSSSSSEATSSFSSEIASSSSSALSSSSSSSVVSSSSSSANIIGDAIDGIKDIFSSDGASSSSSMVSSSSVVSSSSSSSVMSSSESSASSSSEAAINEGTTGTALAGFTSQTDIPEVTKYNYPTIFFNGYTITSYDRIHGDMAEGEAVLAKVLIPAGANKVVMTTDGRSDFMNGLKYGAFDENVGDYCGSNNVCSKEQLENVVLKGGLFSSGNWEDTLYEGEALSVSEYRYVVFYNENGGTDGFSSMKTKITIGNKNAYTTWRNDTFN